MYRRARTRFNRIRAKQHRLTKVYRKRMRRLGVRANKYQRKMVRYGRF
jgi:hypothetical protein